MASLVAPLVSGISTAASGSVEFYRRATSTLAAVYSDSEGETQVTTHALDARGGIVRYVEERVDVLVRDADGAEVLQFTWGTDARDARVENLGFTGPDASGQTVAGGRETVDGALTKLFESLGGVDGQVTVGGVTSSVSEAFEAQVDLVFDVTSSAYGAAGTGLEDDGPEIQAAVNAAVAAGGGILYFPAGTYLITTPVIIPDSTGKLTILGDSASGVTLKQGTSGSTMLDMGAGNSILSQGITFAPSAAANTGALVSTGASGRPTFLSCAFDAIDGTHVAADTGAVVVFIGCDVDVSGASARIGSGDGSVMQFFGGTLSTAGTIVGFSDAIVGAFSGCKLALGTTGGAAGATKFFDGSGNANFVACQVIAAYASGTATIADSVSASFAANYFETAGGAIALAGASTTVREAASDFGSTGITIGGAKDEFYRSHTRDHARLSTSNSATSYTPSGEYMLHEVASSGAAMAFNNPSPDVGVGNGLVIIYKNGSGGNITPTFGTAYSFITAVAQVDAGNSAVYYFVPRPGTLTADLVCISPQPVGGTTL